MEQTKLKNALDLIYLMSCAVNKRVPDSDFMNRLDYDSLYSLSKRHSVTSLIYFPIKYYFKTTSVLPEGLSSELFQRFEDEYKVCAQSAVYFSLERERLYSFFETNGIWYMPMKGIIMQDYYPELGMRQMADNDILFDKAYRKVLKEYMVSVGYSVYSYKKGIHDMYMKAPIYNFELHTALFIESKHNKFDEYFKNIKERLIKDDTNEFGYHMSNEDFYLHSLAHIHKHYFSSGIGIRFLCDIAVFLAKFNTILNFDYIYAELEKMDMVEFERMVRLLSMKLFSKHYDDVADICINLTDDDISEIEYFIGSCTYGTLKNKISKTMDDISNSHDSSNTKKLRYILSRLFPPLSYYKTAYPFLYKYRIFIPFFLIYRLFKAIFCNFKRISGELKTIKKFKKS